MLHYITLFLLLASSICYSLANHLNIDTARPFMEREIYADRFIKFREALTETLKNQNLQERQKYFTKKLSLTSIDVTLLSLTNQNDEPRIDLDQIAFLEYMYSYYFPRLDLINVIDQSLSLYEIELLHQKLDSLATAYRMTAKEYLANIAENHPISSFKVLANSIIKDWTNIPADNYTV